MPIHPAPAAGARNSKIIHDNGLVGQHPCLLVSKRALLDQGRLPLSACGITGVSTIVMGATEATVLPVAVNLRREKKVSEASLRRCSPTQRTICCLVTEWWEQVCSAHWMTLKHILK